MYMDGLNIYNQNFYINNQKFSEDVDKVLEKCVMLVMHKGRQETTEDIELPMNIVHQQKACYASFYGNQ